MDEVRFADGNVSDVVQVGDTVRRATGPWSPAIHALLRHLEAAGFDGAPRFLGVDERGREVLTFVSGRTVPADLAGLRGDDVLVQAGQLLRGYHDAAAGFAPPPGAAWRFGVGAPTAGQVVCHNDAGPWNVVARDGWLRALIDWDLAAPAPPAWDLAYALWRWVPLYPDASGAAEPWGPPAERGRRSALLCDGYGLTRRERRHLLGLVARRMRVLRATVRAWAAAGDPAYAHLWREGHGDVRSDLAYLLRHRTELERHLLR